ncbi:MAG: 5-(carboxyamino)imidazole ribonucleotide synthase [Burkholderiales bacterium]
MILPGAWLGMLGGGQLGRLFTVAARTMGYRVMVIDPDRVCPAAAVADRHLCADFADRAALAEMARTCSAATTEFENVPAPALDFLARDIPVRPRGVHVAIAQDRKREKEFLAAQGIVVAPYRAIHHSADLADAAVCDLLPGILKCSRSGYDGKGQRSVVSVQEAHTAFNDVGGVPCVLEKRLALQTEISVVVARGADGATATYPVAENTHCDGILDFSVVPARVSGAIADEARSLAMHIAQCLDYCGVMCVEYFVLADGGLVVNEIAPRPHNSGHYTIDACATSQFAQQVRVLAGLPLGDTGLLVPAVMVNLLGDLWRCGEPRWTTVLQNHCTRLHLYGKSEARAGRKMGHYTLLGTAAEDCRVSALQIKRALEAAAQTVAQNEVQAAYA